MDRDLEDLIRVSVEVGRDPDLVQGGGGNTSVKTPDGNMYVKASGTALGDMREGAGYRLVDVRRCIAVIEDEELAGLPALEREGRVTGRLQECCVDEGAARPSVESAMHALLGRCIVHTHPSIVNGVLCAAEGGEVVEEVFGDLDPPYLRLEYVDFGYPLAVGLRDALDEYRARHGRTPQLVFLDNHGLIASADEVDQALEMTRSVSEKLRRAWLERLHGVPERREPAFEPSRETELIAQISAALRRSCERILGAPVLVRFSIADPVKALFAHPRAKELAGSPPLIPDQVLYCNGTPMWMEVRREGHDVGGQTADLLDRQAAGRRTPTCLLVDGLGLFAAGLSPRLLDAALGTMEAVLQMLVVAARFGGARALPQESVRFICDSEQETYRHGVAAGERAADAIAGRVAVVSGAGSGLGRGISLGLARKGVHVVLADVDLEAARETARRIADEGSCGEMLPVEADVTSERSVGALFQYVAANLGGLDILVNCAGIAPPHPLIEFPLQDWRRTVEVNLTGYFLMAREAARMMKRQGTGGNIVNISSKTGLEASRNHSGYNATKAGEIHLARGWALELAEHGIRVNTVCPGNVFRESRIWNEDYIKALAGKRGLKPDEVIPYYVGLTALKVEIDWDDIAEAVAFLVSPAASKITGQTLVVDAGQVFVR